MGIPLAKRGENLILIQFYSYKRFKKMKAVYTFLLFTIFIFANCKSQEVKIGDVERDTTTTITNAFSELFLDSIKLKKFITELKLNDADAARLRTFYKNRNYQFAWFTSDGLAEQTRAFLSLHNSYIELTHDSALIDKPLHQLMDLLANDDDAITNLSGQETATTELQLTQHFFKYAQHAYAGKVNPELIEWHIPRKKIDVMALLDSLLANKGAAGNSWEPVNAQYKSMNLALKQYAGIKKAGGWKAIFNVTKKTYSTGDTSTLISKIKQRLMIDSSYKLNDTTTSFTEDFYTTIKRAQKQFGLKENGIINAALVKALNTPVEARIEQLLINMERMRWMLKPVMGNRIVANIPDYKLFVFDSSTKVFEMEIVAGTEAHQTVVFSDVLKYVVFSPYWNVPRSIVRKEILPGIRKNNNYLARHNMEQTGTENGLPVIRQRPGGANALGKVKFIFPNSYNIYFHDTPSKSLFENEKRAFSHGCIRISNPTKMAEYLLRNQPEWTVKKIYNAMNALKEVWVPLKEQVPVLITYFTAWVDIEGKLNFRDDVYGNDEKMSKLLFIH